MGMDTIGVNTPHKKTNAMRTTVAGGIASGMSRKGAESNSPNAENTKEEKRIPTKNRGRFDNGEKGIMITV